MSRRTKPKWKPLPERAYGDGSLSRDIVTGIVRARLPTRISPNRRSREFKPNAAGTEGDAAAAWLDSFLRPSEIAGTPSDTLGTWTGYWHITFVAATRPPTTARLYLWALAKLSEHFRLSLAELRLSHLQTVVNRIAPTLTPPVLQSIIGIWRRCLDAAVNEGLIVRNPARQVIVPSAEQQSATPERRHITPSELAILWPEIRAERFEAAFALVFGCGLRIGEVLGLHWEHVDLDGGRAWIQHQFTEGVWRNLPKGRNPHWVRLPPPVVDALRRQRASQPDGTLIVMQSAYGRLRKKDRDGSPWPWSRATIAADLAKFLERLGIDPATPHSGRHGLASFWLDGGVPPAVVAQRLGHANAGITMQFYAHASQEGHQLADELTAQLLSGTAQNGVSHPDPDTLGSELGGEPETPIESDGDSV